MPIVSRCDKCGKESVGGQNAGFSLISREAFGPVRLGDRNPETFLFCLDCVFELWHEVIPKWAKGDL